MPARSARTTGPWPRPWPPRCSAFPPSPSPTWPTSCAGPRRRWPSAWWRRPAGSARPRHPTGTQSIWAACSDRRRGLLVADAGLGTINGVRLSARALSGLAGAQSGTGRGGAPGRRPQSVRRGARPPPAEPSVAGRSRRARGGHPAWRRVAPGRSGDERPLDRTSPAAGHPVSHEPGDPLLIRLGQVRPSIVPLEARSQLGSLPAEPVHEVLTDARSQVERDGRHRPGPGLHGRRRPLRQVDRESRRAPE